jgi:flagellar hook-length control protein FliK
MIDLSSLNAKLFKADTVHQALRSAQRSADDGQPAEKFQQVLTSVQHKPAKPKGRAAEAPTTAVDAPKDEPKPEAADESADDAADDATLVAEQGGAQPTTAEPKPQPEAKAGDATEPTVKSEVAQPTFDAKLQSAATQQPTQATAQPAKPQQPTKPQPEQPLARLARHKPNITPKPQAEAANAPQPEKPAADEPLKPIAQPTFKPVAEAAAPQPPSKPAAPSSNNPAPQQQDQQPQQHAAPTPQPKHVAKHVDIDDDAAQAIAPANQPDAPAPTPTTAATDIAPVTPAPQPHVAHDTHAAPTPAQPADPTAAQQPTNDEPRIAEQALRGLRAVINQRGGSLTLRLTPAELGEVRIKVDLSNNIVRANFEASTDAARATLEGQLSSLKTALESHGLSVQHLQVHSIQNTAFSSFNQQSSDNSANDGRSRGSFDQSPGQSPGRQEQPNQQPRDFRRELLDLVA